MMHKYHIKYYTSGCFLTDTYVTARTVADAIAQVIMDHHVIEMHCVHCID